jgi:hypothetical protein
MLLILELAGVIQAEREREIEEAVRRRRLMTPDTGPMEPVRIVHRHEPQCRGLTAGTGQSAG